MLPYTQRWTLALLILICFSVSLTAQGGRGFGGPPANPAGKWSGTWMSFNPAEGAAPPKEQCKTLTADVTRDGETWKAVFEGDCGRPYTYTITMEGRQAGPAVLFKGTVDLGPKDGGVFDWVGRATDTQFIGFYTSAFATGTFSLTRVP